MPTEGVEEGSSHLAGFVSKFLRVDPFRRPRERDVTHKEVTIHFLIFLAMLCCGIVYVSVTIWQYTLQPPSITVSTEKMLIDDGTTIHGGGGGAVPFSFAANILTTADCILPSDFTPLALSLTDGIRNTLSLDVDGNPLEVTNLLIPVSGTIDVSGSSLVGILDFPSCQSETTVAYVIAATIGSVFPAGASITQNARGGHSVISPYPLVVLSFTENLQVQVTATLSKVIGLNGVATYFISLGTPTLIAAQLDFPATALILAVDPVIQVQTLTRPGVLILVGSLLGFLSGLFSASRVFANVVAKTLVDRQ